MRQSAVLAVLGTIGSTVAWMFGGWDAGIEVLVIFMAVDYITGLAVALVFKTSKKTPTGAAQSSVGWKGLMKKGGMLLVVLVAHRLDLVIGSSLIRDGCIVAFIVNETISVIENAGLMGIPIPGIILRAVDVLKRKID